MLFEQGLARLGRDAIERFLRAGACRVPLADDVDEKIRRYVGDLLRREPMRELPNCSEQLALRIGLSVQRVLRIP
jgi:hypothetical protein